jgi:hypothetical protein
MNNYNTLARNVNSYVKLTPNQRKNMKSIQSLKISMNKIINSWNSFAQREGATVKVSAPIFQQPAPVFQRPTVMGMAGQQVNRAAKMAHQQISNLVLGMSKPRFVAQQPRFVAQQPRFVAQQPRFVTQQVNRAAKMAAYQANQAAKMAAFNKQRITYANEFRKGAEQSIRTKLNKTKLSNLNKAKFLSIVASVTNQQALNKLYKNINQATKMAPPNKAPPNKAPPNKAPPNKNRPNLTSKNRSGLPSKNIK